MALVWYETRVERSRKRRAIKRRTNKHQIILRLWGQGYLSDKKLFPIRFCSLSQVSLPNENNDLDYSTR